jgi:hypothetical protein
MVDLKFNAPDDVEIVLAHEVVDRVDSAVRAVFNGQNAVLAKSLGHSVENALKALEIQDIGCRKQLVARLLGIGAFHALTGDDARAREKLGRIFKRPPDIF